MADCSRLSRSLVSWYELMLRLKDSQRHLGVLDWIMTDFGHHYRLSKYYELTISEPGACAYICDKCKYYAVMLNKSKLL